MIRVVLYTSYGSAVYTYYGNVPILSIQVKCVAWINASYYDRRKNALFGEIVIMLL